MIQSIFLLALRYPRVLGRIYRRLAPGLLRRTSITFDLAGMPLRAPADHLLPFFRRDFPDYSANLGRLVGFLSHECPRLCVIDIGANIGDSVAIIRAYSACPILCVEGEPRFLEFLRSNTAADPGVKIEPSLIGGGNESVGLTSAGGTASVAVHNDSAASIRMITCDALIDSHPEFDGPGLLKIDTDGFDLHILATASRYLARQRPVLFIEFDPHFIEKSGDHPQRLRELLIPAGYGPALIYDHLGDVAIMLDVTQDAHWEDVIAYLSGRGGRAYADVCIFPSERADQARRFHASERATCLTNRRQRLP